MSIKAELVVIGGGPAGLSAAVAAYDAGVTDVVILDEKATATVFCIEDNAVFLSQIGVLPGLRGGGWGRKLLTAAMQSYVGKTCYVFSKNENADRFYHALGFVPVGSWQDYFRKDQENDS